MLDYSENIQPGTSTLSIIFSLPADLAAYISLRVCLEPGDTTSQIGATTLGSDCSCGRSHEAQLYFKIGFRG
jgi:hypothetical protein